jgi:maltose alpha-D-glucosyltransferase/alpha-amylase
MGMDEPWYKEAIFYQLHIRAFADGNHDGIGDFLGATQKLDYLQELGISGIWLLPFCASPLKDDGYDVADYYHLHPDYGTLKEFQEFIEAAHARNIRVIADLVLNHTSDQHSWFRESRSSPISPKRDYYVWSVTPDRYRQARVIFKDFETSNWEWDTTAQAYYWHRFFRHQPDLNYENPRVQQEMLDVMRFWLDRGLDGFRCDAAPHLFEREGTTCENLPETHTYCKALRRTIDGLYPGRILLAEANQSPAETCAYFGDEDEFHMAFYFPLVPRLLLALAREERQPLVDLLAQTPPIPESCQWATFLRNHDEITLSRLTVDEREELLQVYAPDPRSRLNTGIRRRLAPLLQNDHRRLELVHSIVFTLPGSPVLYYGDEIGMGDDVSLADRQGLRTPMQWNGDHNAGFSQAAPERLYAPVITNPVYGYRTVNVEAQRHADGSLLRRLQRLIAVRKEHSVFGRGALEMLAPADPHILSYLRRDEDETVVIVQNLSQQAQSVALDLRRFAGQMPIDLLRSTRCSPVGEQPYLLNLGPYGFSWLQFVTRESAPAPERRAG